ncbi:MAG: DUF2279 domain-containing protein [Deltaproteobacteria bacterium]|nr:DUF2279 domain-containing protein [Deltaproteobacteria bacterium]
MGIATGMILAAAFLFLPSNVLAEPDLDPVRRENPATPTAPPSAAAPDEPISRGLRWKNAAVIGGIGITVGAYGMNKWWKDGFSGSFHTTDEGWFGQDTYAGGGDKVGHAFFSYTGARLLTRVFEAVGNDPGRALRMGAWTSLGVMTGVEVVDGFSKKFRFSMEDAVANAAGAAFAVLVEVDPRVDALLDFRLLYQRSDDARRLDQTDPIADYSGQTFLLALKADGIPRLREIPVVRYLEILVGYNTRGYEPNDGTMNDPQRRIYYGVGINLSRLLSDTVFRCGLKGGKAQRATDTVLEFLEVPGTAALTYTRL